LWDGRESPSFLDGRESPSFLDGRDAHPTITIKNVSYFILIPNH
jgi:hypothetical protein